MCVCILDLQCFVAARAAAHQMLLPPLMKMMKVMKMIDE